LPKQTYTEWRKDWKSVSIKKDLMEKVEYLIETHPEYFIPLRIRNKADFVTEAIIHYLMETQNDVKEDVFKKKTEPFR